jgi:spore maturation protein CgeB
MKVLYVGLLYNYGKQEEGGSYEHYNIEAGFRECAERGLFEVDYLYPDHHSSDFNQRALDAVTQGDYDAIFHVAFNESLDLPESVAKLALRQDIPVIQWDCDSSWRFNNWILPRKDRVSHFVTTHSATVDWYKKNDMRVIRSQWAGSPYYKPKTAQKSYEVTFVGQKHGQMPNGKFVRAEIIDAIMDSGINIQIFGNYWDGYPNWGGYLTDFSKMVEIFNMSCICLNLSNPWHYNTMPQIKGRHFEIPQTGSLQICTPADDLESYFVDGEEIIIANSVEDLIDKIKYYLDNPGEREQIAGAGRQRMLKDHQWEHRLVPIFEQVGVL